MQEENSKNSKILALVLDAAESFRGQKPGRQFLGKVVSLLSEISVESAERICTKMPLQFKAFPDLIDVNQLIYWEKLRVKPKTQKEEPMWESTKCPGLPASAEALFNMFERGETETGAFEFGRRYCGLSEKELMDAYELFKQGQVHEKIRKLNRGPVQFSLNLGV